MPPPLLFVPPTNSFSRCRISLPFDLPRPLSYHECGDGVFLGNATGSNNALFRSIHPSDPLPNCFDPPYAISMWVFDGGGDLQKWKRYCAPPPHADGLSLFISRGPVRQWFATPTSSTWRGAMSRWSVPFSLLSYSWGLCRNRKSEAETFSRRKLVITTD